MQTPTLLLLLSSLSFLTVSATPPACLLAAINVQTDPSDLKSLCGTLESAVAGNITAKCSAGDQYKSAVSAYEATCFEGAGVNITITSSSSSSAASATGTGTASGSVTATSSGAKITASGTAAATGTATGTSGSTASATGSSASASGITVASGAGALVVPGLLTCVGLVGAVLF